MLLQAITLHIVWCWKADYWNLGAGAEIGIYSTSDLYSKNQSFYEVDTNLTITANMKVTYKNYGLITTTLNDFTQTNWWICSFTPEVQLPNVNWIGVDLKIKFNNESRWKAFYNQREDNRDTDNVWSEVSLADSDYISKKIGHWFHKCDYSYPLACVCQYTCCDNPCGYLSDDGYEFYINY